MTADAQPACAIRVLLADDHPLFLAEAARAFSTRDRFEVVAQLADGRAALESILGLRPDIAVLDLELPSLSGLQLIDAIRRERLPTRVVVLSAFHDGPRVHRAVAGGARAYLDKSSPAEFVAETVERVHAGGTVLPGEVQSALVRQIRELEEEAEILTERELRILRLAADGLSSAVIAERLAIGRSALKGELYGIYSKLEVSDRAAAVAQAIRHQLL